MPEFTYTVVKVGEESGIGGIMPIPPTGKGMPPVWMSYVTVDNVDTTAKKAEQLGGKTMAPPRDIPDVGRFAVIQDPQGAAIAVITYLNKK
jgi:predicted enzyme related to lactoylglutathione lyase